ncbi:Bug family tripartite tricarboxylate transporter substrate binding protein [Rhodoplanes sp. Z2-YC6860]|uniref:Bug family tripartite tricarboxylate transporter substrate binding protein n=1 Tax=Rhodoplanes sp. Z2-YC6860 TaxID=674703 RepID=UPI00078D3E70|nr:tripartite tricarboxylate transporter substrate binding protein [Rhodoplanes sp. Z2-YC6860]AMN41856.1 extracytoplasmic binding receptor [Rhodoplanes sp. Z2-YC6860]
MNFTRLALIASLALLMPAVAAAQDWPTRPIRAIIPFGAGSATDLVPRIVFDQLSPQLGQPIVVENRTGAGGTLGTNAVAKADPDGYTLLAHSNAFSVSPAIYANLPYDTERDFAPVAAFGSLPAVLVISPSKGFKTIQEMVAAAKANPGSFNFASVGVGSGTHLSAEKLKLAAGFQATHVPFRGGPEALTEVITGRVEFYFCPINTALPYIRDGKLVALVTNGATRAPELPDVPTILEAGYRNAEFPIWIGMLAPAGTPAAVVDRLNAETIKAVKNPDTQMRLAKAGISPLAWTPAEFAARIKAEVADNIAVAKAAGIKPN